MSHTSLVSALLMLATLAGPASAQEPAPARVLILGTYHFANPGLDVVRSEVADVLTPQKQAEIARVVESLSRFQPTKIAIERLPQSAARVDSLYRAYREKRRELARDEGEQIGFRLAARFDHPRLHPIDHRGEFPFGELMTYLQKNDPALAGQMQRRIGQITAEHNARQREMSVGGILRVSNDPGRLAADHGLYVRLAAVGAGDTYVGADLLSKWYDRNIRIFSNLQRIASPGDRIVVIIGSGHAAILRELVRYAPGMELVETLDYLPPS